MIRPVPPSVPGTIEERDARAELAESAEALVTNGTLFALLSRRVALRTVSTDPEAAPILLAYLETEMRPELEAMGFECRVVGPDVNPMLIARRIEDERLPTIFGYGHGDTVGEGRQGWSEGLSAFTLIERDGHWYGRGIVDNKGQHAINLAALRLVLQARGSLGFNAIWLIEMGEETGSPGLRELCHDNADLLRADVLIGSDGPRVDANRPTLYLGSRGAVNFTLSIEHRDSGHHSGNWGGLLANPAIELAHALATLTNAKGRIQVPGWTPGRLPESVRQALATIDVHGGPSGPAIEPEWGEPGLSVAEQLYGWSSFEVLAMTSGDPEHPLNAVPPSARAYCQLRTVVGVDETKVVENLRAHLDAAGFPMVRIEHVDVGFVATRLDPADPWVTWVADRIAQATGKTPAVLPNVGASLPNNVFAETLGMRTIWIPHSYPGAQNHGRDEHLPVAVAREALRTMALLYWDIGDPTAARPAV